MLMNKLNDFLYNTDHQDINHFIAKYIKRHLDDIDNMTIEELAQACFVSKAKISKFCKTLGYDSFIAFKDDCFKEKETKQVVLEIQKVGLEVEFQEHLHNSLKIIEANLTNLDPIKIDLLVKEIKKAQYIYLFGIAYSNLLCKYIQYECDFLNKEVIVLDEKLSKDYVMKENSLLIVMSVDGLGLQHDARLFRKLMRYPVKKWIISTDVIDSKLLVDFDESVIILAEGTDVKDRRLLVRYFIDIIMGRFQYLNM